MNRNGKMPNNYICISPTQIPTDGNRQAYVHQEQRCFLFLFYSHISTSVNRPIDIIDQVLSKCVSHLNRHPYQQVNMGLLTIIR